MTIKETTASFQNILFLTKKNKIENIQHVSVQQHTFHNKHFNLIFSAFLKHMSGK
jgi:hypothetical protein